METHSVKLMVNIRVEPLGYMIIHGLPEMAYDAWMETGYGNEHPDEPYGPDWEMMQKKEQVNELRMIAMREGEKLIGYIRLEIFIDDHNASLLTATMRDIFVAKDKRGYAASLVRYVEKLLPSLGIRRSMIGERVHTRNNAAQFYKAMGYELREQVYGKTIH